MSIWTRYLPKTLMLMAVLALSRSPAIAQKPRLRFEERPSIGTPISGAYLLRIGRDPLVRPNWARIEIRVGNAVRIPCESLPAEKSLDTRLLPNGPQQVRLVQVDTRTSAETLLDDLTLYISNAPMPSPMPIAPPAPLPAKEEPTPKPTLAPTPKPETNAPVSVPKGSLVRRVEPVEATPTPDPLKGRASSLATLNDRLFIGQQNGDITVYDTRRKKGVVVTSGVEAGRVVALCPMKDSVWWLVADQPVPGKRTGPPRYLVGYRFTEATRTVVELNSPALKDVISSAATTRLVAWNEIVGIVSGSSRLFINAATGDLVNEKSLFPPDLLKELAAPFTELVLHRGVTIAITANADSTEGVRAATLWKHDGTTWASDRSFNLADDPGSSIPLSTRLRLQALAGPDVFSPRPDLNLTINESSQVLDQDVWWSSSGALWRYEAEKGRCSAFVPWNSGGPDPAVFAADTQGVWIAGKECIVRLDPSSRPDPRSGYNGFVRVSLGAAHDAPQTAAQKRLDAQILEWQGVPYLYGGSTKQGTDCSGFIMAVFRAAGYELPHGSAALRTMQQGRVVTDELRWGDILTYPGHAAIYIGDGKTAETVSGKVGMRTIWIRSDVVVRRVLDDSADIRSQLAARKHSATTKAPARKRNE